MLLFHMAMQRSWAAFSRRTRLDNPRYISLHVRVDKRLGSSETVLFCLAMKAFTQYPDFLNGSFRLVEW